ncbi:helix-turn-helix domain-containing protein [Enterococcus columbae]|uniref:PucR C-terminal helix-turn-helix domain-containing protein n=1 Tax=Enterococcus columbae DSM 7374 = ATCC 51263 TaxID=1121865 RepID=S0KIE5_9ENTE|nr:helix-turn-helix domain-containing protein [Enterococcus columbae]EOT39888.1 hypothetical protein OMW_01677 [Enterococcus columbae DSM 7374 = ATCC 51263]EOW83873.1 hypothetical protein I568_01320 [Enterococcus columbae DSM 7374 = ATCC 51263]
MILPEPLDLAKIYPNGYFSPDYLEQKGMLCLPYQQQYFCIAEKELSPSEIQLLQSIFQLDSFFIENQKKPWYFTLFQGKVLAPTLKERHFRLIQVDFRQIQQLNYRQWQEAIQAIWPSIVEVLFLNPHQAILVEQQEELCFTLDEIEGIFNALDDDFSIYTQLYVGTFCIGEADFQQIFSQEQQLFSGLKKEQKQKKCYDLSMAAIYVACYQNLSNSYLFELLAATWFDNQEWELLILTLWNNQGNISSTAKELFMHRNTLLYKLEKFQQKNNLNLKELDSLLLAYLVLQLKK